MKKKLVFITEKENENFNDFLLKFKNDSVSYENEKFYLVNDNQEEIFFENIVLDFNDFDDQDYLLEIIKNVINNTFKTVNALFIQESEDDYSYVNNNDTFEDIFERKIGIMSYEINDIFDFFTISFISVLEKHKLRNGNKRFCFNFLINLLEFFGFYFKNSKKNNKIFENHKDKEEEIFCFVTRLSNRTYEDLMLNSEDEEFKQDNYKNQIYKNCFNFIKENDKDIDYRDRKEKVKKEIKEWIIKNTIILI
ncbi:type II toxin-antitoxin system death-on-curing family toxin [Mycoplasma sp. 480]|uniref:type II toxin-antitoxin system death-on-curing family toxin n=1 Tax=Mycoplasma sp. 480 TaxID=3440155 RepID=UPI003F50D93E